jgi:hypothetical protein
MFYVMLSCLLDMNNNPIRLTAHVVVLVTAEMTQTAARVVAVPVSKHLLSMELRIMTFENTDPYRNCELGDSDRFAMMNLQ